MSVIHTGVVISTSKCGDGIVDEHIMYVSLLGDRICKKEGVMHQCTYKSYLVTGIFADMYNVHPIFATVFQSRFDIFL